MLQKHISQYSDQELDEWIQHLVADRCPESMTLEYKSEQTFAAKARLEIAKDISSLANTKGGTIIYGIPETHLPDGAEEVVVPSNEYGIEAITDFESRLENALTDSLSPHLPDLWVKESSSVAARQSGLRRVASRELDWATYGPVKRRIKLLPEGVEEDHKDDRAGDKGGLFASAKTCRTGRGVSELSGCGLHKGLLPRCAECQPSVVLSAALGARQGRLQRRRYARVVEE